MNFIYRIFSCVVAVGLAAGVVLVPMSGRPVSRTDNTIQNLSIPAHEQSRQVPAGQGIWCEDTDSSGDDEGEADEALV